MSRPRRGFSVVEMTVAIVILVMGVLAMGASTGYTLGQMRAAELRKERLTAVRQTAETLRGTDWDVLETACAGGPFVVGRFSVGCSVFSGARMKQVHIVSVGPDYSRGRLVPQSADTMEIRLPEPMTGT